MIEEYVEKLNSNLGNVFNLNEAIPLETDMNNLVNSENKHILKMARYKDGSCLNTPLTQGIDGASEGIVFSFCNSTLYATQICSPICSEHIYLRYCTKGTFSSWKVLA